MHSYNIVIIRVRYGNWDKFRDLKSLNIHFWWQSCGKAWRRRRRRPTARPWMTTFIKHLQEKRWQLPWRVEFDTQHSLRVSRADGPEISDLHQDLGPVDRLMGTVLGDVSFVSSKDLILNLLDRFCLTQTRTICKYNKKQSITGSLILAISRVLKHNNIISY
jgi:hypothetical protein